MQVIETPPNEIKDNRWPKLRWQESYSKPLKESPLGVDRLHYYVLEINYGDGKWLEIPGFNVEGRQIGYPIHIIKGQEKSNG